MDNNNIKVSVIMPVYNSGEYLKTAVESILNQSLREIELILVDDGSTDGSSERCDEYAAKDSRVVVIHQKNGGICNARNAALKIARGEYIGFSDHDDEFTNGMYERCISIINTDHPDMLKFGKRVDFIDKHNNVYRTDVFTFEDKSYDREQIVEQYLDLRQKSMFRFVWDGWFKASIIHENNIEFDPYYRYGGEDHEFCNVFSRYARTIRTIPDIFYVHYLRQSFSTSFKKVDFLYNKEEGKRVNKTLDIIGYEMKGKGALYLNQMFESVALCIIRYDLRIGMGRKEIISELKTIEKEDIVRRVEDRIDLRILLAQSKKLGIFTYLYYKKWYSALIWLCKLRYALMK